ncbi:Agamous-like MADS-box protein AGL80 [Dichanthelium oligosanthes]|uniref:Agamous-like MADS-box protein AGL80 n=1 Tax=Dichanthelium oligosanthes TaxID=888268 RepID=A0A1E5ULN7_9POAL|nr:Agamous-like MADS-box protein AGL80 [Dichanthelium oligosanthes]
MARKKVTLQWIANDSTRRATFKKRRKGLMKKASELATLCDVDACVVVYGEGEAQPEVWPDVPKVAQVLARFKAMPELDQCKKMMDMEGFLNQRIEKLKEQLHKAQRENRERETTILLHDAVAGRRPGLVGLSVEEIASLGWMVENRIHGVRDALERLQAAGKGPQDAPATTLQLQLPQVPGLPLVPYGIGPAGHRDVQAPPPHPQAWLMDVAKAGGDLGALVYSGFGGVRGSFGGASTSASGAADMPPPPPPPLGNMGPGFVWAAADPGLPFPPM